MSRRARASHLDALRPLFSATYYAAQLPTPSRFLPPPAHYAARGWLHQLSPHPLFDPVWYWQGSPRRIDPLAHYVAAGHRTGRSPHPLFDPNHYRSQLARRGLDLAGTELGHYVEVGHRLGLDPHPYVSNAWYYRAYPDVRDAGVEPLTHFLLHGRAEGRILSGWLDIAYVVDRYRLSDMDVAGVIREVMSRLVPERLPTRRQQSPLLDIMAARAALPGGAAGPPPQARFPEVPLAASARGHSRSPDE